MSDSNVKSMPAPMPVPSVLKSICLVAIVVGLFAFGYLLSSDQDRAWHAYLTGYFYFFIIAIGGLFFTGIQHLVRAGWSVNIRRFSEALTAYLPVAFVGGLILLIGGKHLWEWMDSAKVHADPLLEHKASYLNTVFFVVRMVAFFGLWMLFTKKLVGGSLAQDKSGDDSISEKSVGWAVGCILTFALSFSLFSVDLIMSLEPRWFSTIFGVYCFAGLFQSTIATMILLILYCRKKGLLAGYVDENHLHDLGKFLFAFTVFWAYIAYSQYMLIWYANLPEETLFYMPRVTGSWMYVSAALLLFKFVVPFLALLSRRNKRNPAFLGVICVLILIMQYVDLYWLIYPNLNGEKVIFGLPEILVWLGFGGIFLFTVTRFLGTHAIVPFRDPRIHESLHHHVTY
ncbi:MAG: molybdopterin oxidoreductase [Bdellovibrionales bacterium]